MMAIRSAALLAALALVACSSPPTTVTDTTGGFAWATAFSDLDEAVLSACGGRGGGDILAVGGTSGRGAIFSFSGGEWRAENLPAETGVLWWCWAESGSDRVWAVGEGGTVLTRTGGVWQWVDTFGAVPEEVTLFGIWGAAGNDIYAVGGSLVVPEIAMAIVHYNGQTWAPVDVDALPASTLFKVWGTSGQDVWAVGASGTAVHYDGTSWTASDTGSEARLTAVWGTGPTDVYAVGGLGIGEVLHHDGSSWSLFANEAEDLAGVYTAPGQPLYVGGNRGLLVRYDLDESGRPSADRATRATPFPDVDVHALHRADDALLGAASDLLSGGTDGWRGTLLFHGDAALTAAVVRPMYPDAGMGDAGMGDAGMGDAGSQGPGPGEECGNPPDICAPGLECWLLQDGAEYLCTQPCTDPSECTAYGPDACCERPGFQTLERVCIPGDRPTCNG